jgi:hypothetical protein
MPRLHIFNAEDAKVKEGHGAAEPQPKRPDARSRKPARKSGKPGLSAVGFRLSEKSHEAIMPIVFEFLSGCEDLKTL